MTIEELYEKFDDEHLTNIYAASVLDGEGEDDRRTARICATVTSATLNAVRLGGKPVDSKMYLTESDFIPSFAQPNAPKIKRQSWNEMKGNLGF